MNSTHNSDERAFLQLILRFSDDDLLDKYQDLAVKARVFF